MPRKTKTTKKRPQRRKSMYAVDSMNRTMQATTQMVGNVAMAGMAVGLAGSVIGSLK